MDCKAKPEDWELQSQWASDCADARCLLELRARVEALEAAKRQMTDYRFVPLNTLENRLGDALGLAISMIRKPETIDNKAMAQIEAPFKEWCDGLVDGGSVK